MKLTLSCWPRRGRNRTASRTEPKPELTDGQWFLIAECFAELPMSSAGGRPRVPPRPCLEGILRTGAQWKELPNRFPSPSTCWRRLQEWTESGVFQTVWARLLRHPDRKKGPRAQQEAIGDGTFAPAKKGAPRSARPRKGRGRS